MKKIVRGVGGWRNSWEDRLDETGRGLAIGAPRKPSRAEIPNYTDSEMLLNNEV